MTVLIDGKTLTIEMVEEIARRNVKVAYSDEAQKKIERCRELVQKMVDSGKAIYGVTTGIGEFSRIRVSPEQGSQLQKNIIYSHAAGTGDPQSSDVVRAAMTLRANVLARGHSGVRYTTAEIFIKMLKILILLLEHLEVKLIYLMQEHFLLLIKIQSKYIQISHNFLDI